MGLAITALAQTPASQPGWWNADWKYRRPVNLKDYTPADDPEHQEVAVFTLLTGGQIREDAQDIRVVTSEGQVCPSRLVSVGPGDVAEVLFALVPQRDLKYWVYFGNPNARPAPPLELRRGLLLTMWAGPKEPLKSLEQIQKFMEKAPAPLGQILRPKIFYGHNPFNEENNVVSQYVGYLHCPKDGLYTFTTLSSDASYLLIDDRIVVNNGGEQRPSRWPRKKGLAQLSAGIHKLTVYHASQFQSPVIVAAWIPPEANAYEVIPAEAFAPVFHASAGGLQSFDSPRQADFSYRRVGDTRIDERYLQKLAFRASPSGERFQYHWDFGDGQTSELPQPEHVYLSPGLYPVGLTVRMPDGRQSRQTHRINANHLGDRVIVRNMDPPAEYVQIVETYDFSRMKATEELEAMRLFEACGQAEKSLPAIEQFLQTRSADPEPTLEILKRYLEWLPAREHPSQAVETLKKALKLSEKASYQAELHLLIGRILLNDQNDDAAAQEHFEKALSSGEDELARRAQIGLGEVWAWRGDYPQALEAYRKAGVRLNETGSAVTVAVRRGDYARRTEDALRRKDLVEAAQALQEWTDAIPEDRLNGYATLMAVRLEMMRSHFSRAATLAEKLVAVNPSSSYAPQLLSMAVACYRTQGKIEPSDALLQRLLREYPESAEAGGLAK